VLAFVILRLRADGAAYVILCVRKGRVGTCPTATTFYGEFDPFFTPFFDALVACLFCIVILPVLFHAYCDGTTSVADYRLSVFTPLFLLLCVRERARWE